MPYPHAMRLHGPWEYQPLSRWLRVADGTWRESATDLPSAGRLHVPSDWGAALGADYHGRVRFTRRFGKPTGLEARERVWLVIEGVDARGEVALNGQPLGEVPGYALPASFDVTERLLPRNELEIVVEAPRALALASAPLRPGRENQPGGLIREIRLEMRHQNYLKQLIVHATDQRSAPTLHVSVTAAGPDVPLNLHVTGLRRELAFVPVPAGQTVSLAIAVPGLPHWVPGQANDLEPIDFRLLRGGEAVWEDTRFVTVRDVVWHEPSRSFCVNGQPFPSVQCLASVATEEQLQQFDAQGTPIIQAVPRPWAEEVCARLAHHPSIVAWAEYAPEPADVSSSSGSQMAAGQAYGRPWARMALAKASAADIR